MLDTLDFPGRRNFWIFGVAAILASDDLWEFFDASKIGRLEHENFNIGNIVCTVQSLLVHTC